MQAVGKNINRKKKKKDKLFKSFFWSNVTYNLRLWASTIPQFQALAPG